jgi:alpha-glucosidase (family GH31 glycosyl hydrolase)
MKRIGLLAVLAIVLFPLTLPAAVETTASSALYLGSRNLTIGRGSLALDSFFYDTTNGRVSVPAVSAVVSKRVNMNLKMPDGRTVTVSVTPDGNNYELQFSASPNNDIIKWGLAIQTEPTEYFTGLMERVVDGPQDASWASSITAAMNLRGHKVDMILKPTTSVYAPFYISSRGYATFAKTDWPGAYDFCVSDTNRVKIEFEGPSLQIKIYTARTPAELVKAHAVEAGPPILPPKWTYTPWRWRDEHKQTNSYYDGTPVTGPFNSQFMEDTLLMKAYGIPCGVYWIDRPWGPGTNGCDDFEIDPKRLPNFAQSVKWLDSQDTKMVLWIAPFFQGEMETNALQNGYNIACQKRMKNNYPMVDFTNPAGKKYWQDGFAKFLKLGVAGFKLDRGEENIPENGPYQVFDGRSIRENRNAYPLMYIHAAYEVAKKYRGKDFALMPRAGYTGTARYSVNWGGDIGGTQEGLRASIIAVQRSAVMGYANWGSDTCGYNRQLMETEVCGRWLGFSCFTPIMEVGPTDNRAFWDFHKPARYDADLIAMWRLYARLHDRLADYSYAAAKEASKSGMPIVRPLFLVEPQSPVAWSNWWTYLYGPDLVVSPIWKKEQRTQDVYLPLGAKWRDAWDPEKVYNGGQTITVHAELHQIPVFVRVGSKVQLGDLNQEWADAVAAAAVRPDLKKLDADLKAWFDKKYPPSRADKLIITSAIKD